jgi:hypothetical protein
VGLALLVVPARFKVRWLDPNMIECLATPPKLDGLPPLRGVSHASKCLAKKLDFGGQMRREMSVHENRQTVPSIGRAALPLGTHHQYSLALPCHGCDTSSVVRRPARGVFDQGLSD